DQGNAERGDPLRVLGHGGGVRKVDRHVDIPKALGGDAGAPGVGAPVKAERHLEAMLGGELLDEPSHAATADERQPVHSTTSPTAPGSNSSWSRAIRPGS